jgi:hypothetical protein
LAFVLTVALARFAIARRYWRAPQDESSSERWDEVFVAGTALAAAGWGVTGMLFYDPAQPMNGVFLMFWAVSCSEVPRRWRLARKRFSPSFCSSVCGQPFAWPVRVGKSTG